MRSFIVKHYKFLLYVLFIILLNILFLLCNISVLTIVFQLITFLSILSIAIYFANKFDNMKNEASTCSLTKIYNRKKFFEILDNEIKRSERTKSNLAAMFFDIDNFGDINKRFGHYTGDQILVAMTQTILGALRPYDTMARVGGEEFSIIMPDTSIEEAYLIAERVRKSVEGLRINKGLVITISIGVGGYHHSDTADDIYKRIDDAMLHAKEKGKNITIIWNDEMSK